MTKKLSAILFDDLDPFAGVDIDTVVDDRKGWGSEDPFLDEIIGKVRPSLILEIGTWKGASAIYMAQSVKRHGLETEIICADPHVGSRGLWLSHRESMHITPKGECGTYDIFLANVKRAGVTEFITPYRVTSSIATSVMERSDLKADIIYIDGSHDPVDVAADLSHVMRVAHEDTVIVCDDYEHPRIKGVTEAVAEFLIKREDYVLVAVREIDLQFYTEKVIGNQTCSKAVLVKKGGKFEKSFSKCVD